MNRFSFDFSTVYAGGTPAPHWLTLQPEQIRDLFSEDMRRNLRAVPAFGRRTGPARKTIDPQ